MAESERPGSDIIWRGGPFMDTTRADKGARYARDADRANSRSGPSKDVFGSEWMTALDRHGKNPRKRKSYHGSAQTDSSTAAPAPRADRSTQSIALASAGLDNSLHQSGLSRHQRRRQKRRMKRKDLIQTEQHTDASQLEQQAAHGRPNPESTAVAWKDKPIGRKAIALQLATTTLMRPPVRRWQNVSDHTQGAPEKRNTAERVEIVLEKQASEADDRESKSSMPGADNNMPPKIRHTGSDASCRNLPGGVGTKLEDTLRSRLPFGPGSASTSKRHSFGSKVVSVPTYMVDGNVAERFKRFSAAAHGRSSDVSSESSSDSSSDAEQAAVPQSPRNGSHAPSSQTHSEQRPRDALDHADEHRSQASIERGAGMGLGTVMSFAELSSASRKQRNSKQTARPSSAAGKQGILQADDLASQMSFPIASQSVRGTSPLDKDLFDAEQTVEDIIQSEMALTRGLPAGKEAPTTNTDHHLEDDLLTRDCSDIRLMQSDAKPQPPMLAKRIDSAIPEAEDDTIIVRSMQLPESMNGSHDADFLGMNARTSRSDEHAQQSDDSKNQPLQPEDYQTRSSSPLSELSQSPSPPRQTANGASPAGSQQESQDEGQNDRQLQAEQSASAVMKKRKMTGLTSKHFSTPKKKKRKTIVVDTSTEDNVISIAQAEETSAAAAHAIDRAGQTPRSTATKELLAETKELLGQNSKPTEQTASEQRVKRARPSGGKITDLSDSNILSSRSRHGANVADHGDEAQETPLAVRNDESSADHQILPAKKKSAPLPKRSKRSRESDILLRDAQFESPNGRRSRQSVPCGKAGDKQTSVDVDPEVQLDELGARPRKRARRSGGPITDFSTDNILPGRSRRSTTTPAGEEATDPASQQQALDSGDEHEWLPEGGSVAAAKLKKRGRRSGGRITDLDSENVLKSSSRSRRRSDKQDVVDEPIEDETREEPDSAVPEEPSATKAKAKRKSTGKRSIYFTPPKPPLDPTVDRVDYYNTTGKKKRAPAGVSVAPVPSIHSDRFGIIQEKLWHEPFWLLIAVTFLNKTAGRAAAPTFWRLKEQYKTPEALAEADQGDLHDMIHHLGLQTQRSKRLIAMSKAWVAAEPKMGVRWRMLHYPEKGDGKAYKAGVPIEEDADDVAGAVEIGNIPGCGPYAVDSWRIFCRDVLRGVAEDYNGNNAEAEGFVPEWQKVLPGDKELRACLRWMWLREGWIWDHETGRKRRATEEEMEMAIKGEMEVADEQEKRFAERAVGLEAGELKKGGGEDHQLEEDEAARVRQSAKGRQRAATLEKEYDDGDLSDNIIVGSPGQKRRSNRRTTA